MDPLGIPYSYILGGINAFTEKKIEHSVPNTFKSKCVLFIYIYYTYFL